MSDDRISAWIDKLEIRELIETSMRHIDDERGDLFAMLFEEDGAMQLSGTVFAGRDALRALWEKTDWPHWTKPGQLLMHPLSAHLAHNPVIDIDGDTATAETDMTVIMRGDDGKYTVTMAARYRDRLRRGTDGQWRIVTRTGVSLGRPGQAHTDAEWARALAKMPEATRAKFRLS
jgi:ketosteroid isomerase-like protein